MAREIFWERVPSGALSTRRTAVRTCLRIVAVAGVVVMCAALFFGCGGDDGEAAKSADELYEECYAALMEDLETADLGLPPSQWGVDFAGALDCFEEVLDKDPNHPEALMTTAMVRLMMLVADPDLEDIINEIFPDGDGQPRSNSVVEALFWYTRGVDATALLEYLRSRRDDPAFSDIQAFIEDEVLPALSYIDSALERFEELDAEILFSFEVPGGARSSAGGELPVGRVREEIEIEIDATDAYFAHVPVDILQATLHVLVSYNVDVEEWQTAQHLMESDPDFLTLRDAAHPAGAYDELVAAARHLDDACDALDEETDDQTNDVITKFEGWIPLEDEAIFGPGAVDTLRMIAGELDEALLNGLDFNPAEEEPGAPDIDVHVDLYTLFNSPLDDLRSYFPAHTWVDSFTMEVERPIEFDDPTFENIFPDMTNADWEELADWLTGGTW